MLLLSLFCDCFMDTVKIHNHGKKYNGYFCAIMYQTLLPDLDDLRAVTAANSIFIPLC